MGHFDPPKSHFVDESMQNSNCNRTVAYSGQGPIQSNSLLNSCSTASWTVCELVQGDIHTALHTCRLGMCNGDLGLHKISACSSGRSCFTLLVKLYTLMVWDRIPANLPRFQAFWHILEFLLINKELGGNILKIFTTGVPLFSQWKQSTRTECPMLLFGEPRLPCFLVSCGEPSC